MEFRGTTYSLPAKEFGLQALIYSVAPASTSERHVGSDPTHLANQGFRDLGVCRRSMNPKGVKHFSFPVIRQFSATNWLWRRPNMHASNTHTDAGVIVMSFVRCNVKEARIEERQIICQLGIECRDQLYG